MQKKTDKSFHKGSHFLSCVFMVAGGLLSGVVPLSQAQTGPTNIDRITYFDADIRDAEYCNLSVKKDGTVHFGDRVTNPAMTCPDAFSWYLFTQVVKEEFWTRWADESQNWPKEPWPLCEEGQQKNCCDPYKPGNNLQHCPVFPGKAYHEKMNKAKLLLSDDQAIEKGKALEKNVKAFLSDHADLVRIAAPRKNGLRQAVEKADAEKLKECSNAQLDSILPEHPQSIGRVLRQTNSELTVRNLSFHRYLYQNNLYNANGVLKVFNHNGDNQSKNSPYHKANKSASKKSPTADLYTIDLPPEAIMIKSNWVSARLVKAMEKRYPKSDVQFGDKEDYVRHPMKTVINVKNGSEQCLLSGSHYLMAFHISSKDIPQWVWTTFEHRNNPGRCDYTGCNDSFGYPVLKDDGKPTNFIKPHQHSDHLSESSIVLNNDKQYPYGKETLALNRLLTAWGIGTSSHSGGFANPEDRAWKNYRLKGSQVDFTDHQGMATRLGNSITEGGFMTDSSCIGCHSRAGVAAISQTNEQGKVSESANFLSLGVFEPQLSEFGYEQSHKGIPNHAWYYNDSPTFGLEVLQTDFIWGFLNAQPLVE